MIDTPSTSSFKAKSPGIRAWLRPLLWKSPYLYWPFGFLRQHKNILSRKYDILIDGYPRSANTFAVHALQIAQRKPIIISSHHHNPAAVIAAARAKKPTIVLLREPHEAIASWCIFSGYPIEYNIQTYIDYYSGIFDCIDRIAISDFKEIILHYDKVIESVNIRFGTDFDLPHLTKERQQNVLCSIENEFLAREGAIDETRVSRPSATRDQQKQILVSELTSGRWSNLAAKARAIYDILLAKC